mmetsp:Transcript_18068/g.22778  ORF Transcript_18068/g.22778 Transcript_18068/m.22778 type:complete len:95 (-) Transcript_18068:1811-2095(-)
MHQMNYEVGYFAFKYCSSLISIQYQYHCQYQYQCIINININITDTIYTKTPCKSYHRPPLSKHQQQPGSHSSWGQEKQQQQLFIPTVQSQQFEQ